jgi:hypothetical protein
MAAPHLQCTTRGACGGARVLKHIPAALYALRSRPIRHERQTRHDSRQRPKLITTHRRPRHALRQGERILVPEVSAVIWVVDEFIG